MPLTQVQRVATGSAAAVASLTATWGSTPIQNNLLVARVNSDATVTMTSTGWSLAVSQVNNTGLYLWYKLAGASEAGTVVVTPSSSDSIEIIVEEWSGNDTSSPLDKTASATGASTGTTAATTQADEQAFAQAGSGNLSAAPTGVTWTNSFVTETGIFGGHATLNNRTALSPASKVLSATGAVSSVPTIGTGTTSGCLVATFKASAGGGGPTVKTLAALGVG